MLSDAKCSSVATQDGTLVKTKTGAEYPVDSDDWRLFNDKVLSIVQGYHKDGYKIVIFR